MLGLFRYSEAKPRLKLSTASEPDSLVRPMFPRLLHGSDDIVGYPGMKERGLEPGTYFPNPQLGERINISSHVDWKTQV